MIRLATDADGPAIGKLFRDANEPDYGVNWERPGIAGWWLVAEDGDEIVGAVQVVPSKPFGYIGDLIVRSSHRAKVDGNGALTGRLGSVAFDLLVTAFVVLRNAGIQLVMGAVGKEIDGLRKVYERHGAMNLGEFTVMARRLT